MVVTAEPLFDLPIKVSEARELLAYLDGHIGLVGPLHVIAGNLRGHLEQFDARTNLEPNADAPLDFIGARVPVTLSIPEARFLADRCEGWPGRAVDVDVRGLLLGLRYEAARAAKRVRG